MSSPSPSPRATSSVIEMGTTRWCWHQLSLGGEGIHSYQAPRGRASLAVPYLVLDREISILLGAFNQTGWRAEGGDASLEITGRTPEDGRWVVRATGRARRGDHTEAAEAHAREMHPSQGSDHDESGLSDPLFLHQPRIRGFHETLVATDTSDGQPEHRSRRGDDA